jgi:predicted nucleotidyltransferase
MGAVLAQLCEIHPLRQPGEGDNRPDSDADVAVIGRPIENRWSVKRQIIEDTYPILLATGLYIQPRLLEEGELDDPERSSNPDLVRNVWRDGIPA